MTEVSSSKTAYGRQTEAPRNRTAPAIISTGTTSIVLIFVLLCMLTFSVLSLVSAQANLRLSRLSAQRTTDYYAAENAANEILIDIEDAAQSAVQARYLSSVNYDSQSPAFAREVLKRMRQPDAVSVTEDGLLSYQVPLGEDQNLQVELRVFPEPGDGGRHYEVRVWQAVSRYDWTPDDSLDLALPGNMPTGLD